MSHLGFTFSKRDSGFTLFFNYFALFICIFKSVHYFVYCGNEFDWNFTSKNIKPNVAGPAVLILKPGARRAIYRLSCTLVIIDMLTFWPMAVVKIDHDIRNLDCSLAARWRRTPLSCCASSGRPLGCVEPMGRMLGHVCCRDESAHAPLWLTACPARRPRLWRHRRLGQSEHAVRTSVLPWFVCSLHFLNALQPVVWLTHYSFSAIDMRYNNYLRNERKRHYSWHCNFFRQKMLLFPLFSLQPWSAW